MKIGTWNVNGIRARAAQLVEWLRTGTPIYGITRGLGPLKDEILDEAEELEFQKRILISHATGIGPLFPDDIARLALLIRANVSCIGTFGTRLELIEHIYEQDFERESNTIEVLIGRVRRKLGVDVIKTRRGLGYTLEAT